MSTIKDFEPLWGEWYTDTQVGEGSFGKVYSAHKDAFGHTYTAAIKHISIPANMGEMQAVQEELGTTDPEQLMEYFEAAMRKIMDEYTQLSELKGMTNVVACEDVLSVEKTDMPGYDVFIRMELLESVSSLILAGKMDREETVKMGIDICRALELLSFHNMIHMDIKPQNIFRNQHGDYKLGDFGTAHTMMGTSTVLSAKGTYAYMAPEVANGKPIDRRCDIYTLGLVMYKMMNGNRSPFLLPGQASTVGGSDAATVRRLSGEALPAPKDADKELAAIILKACAYDPDERWRTAGEMGEALEELMKGTAIHTGSDKKTPVGNPNNGPVPIKEMPKPEEKKKLSKVTVGILAGAAALLVVAGVVVFLFVNKSNQYKTAASLMEEGQYAEAYEAYQALGEYKDSAERAEEARVKAGAPCAACTFINDVDDAYCQFCGAALK